MKRHRRPSVGYEMAYRWHKIAQTNTDQIVACYHEKAGYVAAATGFFTASNGYEQDYTGEGREAGSR
jgi:hypothetical protein